MLFIKVLNIEVEGQIYPLSGGDFEDMLDRVREVKGRQWDSDRKLWKLPCSLEETRQFLNPYQVGEDAAFENEISEIEKYQEWILKNIEAIKAEISKLDKFVKGFSYMSKSSRKSSAMIDSGCLEHALKYAEMPIEKLSEPQILTLRKACRLMGWE